MNQKELQYLRAKNKVERTKRFYNHVFVYFIINIIITLIKVWDVIGDWTVVKSELTTINVWSVWAVWGMFLIIHFFVYKFGAEWEERKIEAYMKQELNNNNNF